MTKLGRWPIDRSYYVKFLSILKDAKPRILGIDIILSEYSDIDPNIRDESKRLNVIYPAYFNIDDGSIYLPNPVISEGAFGIGHINITPAVNGYIYSIPKEIPYNNQKIKALSIKLGELYLNRSIEDIGYRDSNFLINYSGQKMNLLCFSDVIEENFLKDVFRDKIVLLGVTAKGIGDYYLAPSYKEPISGLEIHANAVNTIITKNFLKRLPKVVNILLILSFLSSLSLFYNNPLRLLSFGLILIFILIITSFVLFSKGVIIDTPPVFISVILLVGVSQISAYIKEREEKKRIREIFQMYLAPEVVENLLGHPEYWNLKGEELEVTIMFVDISGFTEFTQKHRTEEVVEFLNRYFSLVTDIIFKHRGTLDKFIGDAVMAIYGAPIRYDEHPLESIQSAVEIMEMARKNNIKVKIGINTGNVIIGNIGTERRVQYTVIGDVVNMAEYMESIANPDEILIGERTYNLLRDRLEVEELILTGKFEGRRCYRVLNVR